MAQQLPHLSQGLFSLAQQGPDAVPCQLECMLLSSLGVLCGSKTLTLISHSRQEESIC